MQKTLAALVLAAASALVLSGCATTPGEAAGDDSGVRVVASTNVYGSLAAQIGGDRVQVTSLIDSVAKDPHSYEATARDRLAVQRADLVIENGGGYDSFMQQLREGSDAAVITAAEFSHDFPAGDDHADEHEGEHADEHADDHADEHADEPADEHADHADEHEGHSHIEGFNEHVWFDVHTISHVVEQIVADLGELDPDGAADFAAAAATLSDELTALETELDGLHERHEAQQVFITEPLPGLLAAAAGLDDVAPDGFASAVEEGNDVAPSILLQALDVVENGDLRAVLTTAQTGGSETTRVIDAAERAGVPVVTFSELLADDQSYAEWMRSAIDDLEAALER